ncbi:unnamed protein product [Eruca vesicaria subsp. sativa]|uniref:Uncharacterized protein n=1 Tax=Eruca vesicaria subsp. sativa TaxID=29727 RepID=A0ABC8IYQ8_ERUVS|nr:unnamed protein product [Eruca vesicaria subsp. sativa]
MSLNCHVIRFVTELTQQKSGFFASVFPSSRRGASSPGSSSLSPFVFGIRSSPTKSNQNPAKITVERENQLFFFACVGSVFRLSLPGPQAVRTSWLSCCAVPSSYTLSDHVCKVRAPLVKSDGDSKDATSKRLVYELTSGVYYNSGFVVLHVMSKRVLAFGVYSLTILLESLCNNLEYGRTVTLLRTNTLNMDLRTSKDANSIIHQCFQGELEVLRECFKAMKTNKSPKMTFLMLGLDLPPPPLFKDVMEKNIILPVALFDILKKFDGETVT